MEVRQRHQTRCAGVRKLGLARCSHLDLDLVGPGTIRLRFVSANHDVLPVTPSNDCCEFVDLSFVFYGTGGAGSQFSLVDRRCRWDCRGFSWLDNWCQFMLLATNWETIGNGSRGGCSSGWLGSTSAGSVCRLSLRERRLYSNPAHVTRETRNLNHADNRYSLDTK